eukprot:m51a1_g11006 putative nuclear cap-binding protein subunit 2-like (232) ;mRNA; r:364734-365645
MSHLYTGPASTYFDRREYDSLESYRTALRSSRTLYVGNLSFFTTEDQVWELFRRCGRVFRVIMGLNRDLKTPCGFCFVEYVEREAAERAMASINGTYLDERAIRTDWDPGFKNGRQFGRGASGYQVRDNQRSGDAERPKVAHESPVTGFVTPSRLKRELEDAEPQTTPLKHARTASPASTQADQAPEPAAEAAPQDTAGTAMAVEAAAAAVEPKIEATDEDPKPADAQMDA